MFSKSKTWYESPRRPFHAVNLLLNKIHQRENADFWDHQSSSDDLETKANTPNASVSSAVPNHNFIEVQSTYEDLETDANIPNVSVASGIPNNNFLELQSSDDDLQDDANISNVSEYPVEIIIPETPEQTPFGNSNFGTPCIDITSPEQSIDAFSIDTQQTDQLCTFWPYQLIKHHWNGIKYELSLGSRSCIRRCLKHWCQKCGLYDWLSSDDYITQPIPDIHLQRAANEMQLDIHNLKPLETKLIKQMYTDIIIKDDPFVYMLDSQIHSVWLKSLRNASQTNNDDLYVNYLDDGDDNNNNNGDYINLEQ